MATLEQRIKDFASEVQVDVNHYRALLGIPSTQDDLGASVGPRVDSGQSVKGAIDQLTPQINVDWGSAFPTTQLRPGRKFYRTDLFETFTYTGAQWVGELQTLLFNEASDNDRIRVGFSEISTLSTDGVRLPYDALITRIFANTRANETMTLTWWINSVTANLLQWSGSNVADSGNLAIAWPQGELLNGRVTATSTGNFQRLFATVQYRRVE